MCCFNSTEITMTVKWQKYEDFNSNLHKKIGTRIVKKHHKGKRVDKLFNFSNKVNQNLIYLGEILVVGLFSFSTLIFGNGTSLVNNTSLVYPVDEVSKLECRHKTWPELDKNCKMKLPLIEGANFQKYGANPLYTNTYTVLFGGNYLSGWDMQHGSHYGVDLASSRGTPLYAIADGKVFFAGQQAWYGNVVKIQFIYKGKMYFSTYGHMDQILVQTGQPLTKGQKIGMIGHSGTTMGSLEGNHVHFEIDKGDFGRPIYPFGQCSEAKKSGIETINNGLCREQMYKYGQDPIAFLEGANATRPFDEWGREEHASADNQHSESSGATAESLLEELVKPLLPESPAPVVNLPVETSQGQSQTSSLIIDTSSLDGNGKAFFDEWSVDLTGDLTSPIKKNQTRILKLLIKNKKTGVWFDGILQQPIILVASSTNVSLDPVAISLVKNWEVEIKVQGNQVGTTYTAINLGLSKVASLNLSVF